MRPEPKTSDATKIRETNRASILDVIRSQGPVSRTRIAKTLRVSLSTVLRIVEELIEERLVETCDTKERGAGRPGELLRFNGGSFSIIGVDLGYPNMLGTVASLSGDIHHQHAIPIKRYDGDANLKSLYELIERLLIVSELAHEAPMGIALGVPDIIRNHGSTVECSTNLGWRDLPLSQLVSERVHLPVMLDTDINLITLGEYGFGVGRDVGNLVCMTIGSQILAGIIVDGRLIKGSSGAAGLLGHSLPGVEFLHQEYCSSGALNSVAAGPSVLLHARENLDRLGIESSHPSLDISQVYRAAANGETWSKAVVNEAVDYLSLAVASIATLLDPEMIVISGKLADSVGFLPALINAKLANRIPRMPNLRVSNLGTRSTVMGGIMMIYQGILKRQKE